MPTCKAPCSFKISGLLPSHMSLLADIVLHLVNHCNFLLRFTFPYLMQRGSQIQETELMWNSLSLQDRCYKHQWWAILALSWMHNSGSRTVLGSCLWKECKAARTTDRSFCFWWNGPSLSIKDSCFGEGAKYVQQKWVMLTFVTDPVIVLDFFESLRKSSKASRKDNVTTRKCFRWGTSRKWSLIIMYSTLDIILITNTKSLE